MQRSLPYDFELGNAIVTEARSWVGTPFQHQGRIKGVAVDCANYASLVAQGVGFDIVIPDNYREQEDGKEMLRLLDKYLIWIPDQERMPGDILALCDSARREKDVPRHIVIVESITRVTTYIFDATAHGIRRHRMDQGWERRLHSTYRLTKKVVN